MFDLVPRWALALGVGAISAAGVSTVAIGSASSTQPACAESHSSVLDANACANGQSATDALMGIDQLKGQLTTAVSGAQSQVQSIVADAKSQVASASTSAQSTLGSTMATVTGAGDLTPAFTTASNTIGKVFTDVNNSLGVAQTNAVNALSVL
ncbi:MAG: hypothetical protein QOI86_2020, partial [Actinomycetota bacterium]|nr:hypothetical protein [Actinomycetota bacterium]